MTQIVKYSSGGKGAFAGAMNVLQGLAGSPMGRQVLGDMAASAGRAGRVVIDSVAQGMRGGQVGIRPESRPRRKGKKGKRKNRRRGKGGTLSRAGLFSASRFTNLDRIRVLMKDVQIVSTDGSGNAAYGWQIAMNQTSGLDMRTWLPKITNMANLFTYFHVNALKVQYKPGTGYTSTGNLALCVTDEASVTTPASFSAVMHTDPSILVDVKSAAEVVWTPGDTAEDIDHWCNPSSGATSAATIPLTTQGVIQVYAPTTSVISGTLGYLEFIVDISLYGLKS